MIFMVSDEQSSPLRAVGPKALAARSENPHDLGSRARRDDL